MDFDLSKPHRIVNGEPVLLTDAEIMERKAEEAMVSEGAPKRELERIESESGMDRGERDIAIKLLPPESARRKRAEKAEAEIASLGIRQ